MAIEVNIVNDVIEFVQKDSLISIILAIFTLALVIITAIGIWRTNVHTRKQLKLTEDSNDLLKTELDSKLRPLLQIIKSNSSLVNNPSEHIELSFTIKNLGESAARKISLWYWETRNNMDFHLVKEKDDQPQKKLGTLPKNASTEEKFSIEWDKDKLTTFYALWFQYDYLDKEDERTVVILTVTPNASNLEYKWYVEEDIQEAIEIIDEAHSGNTSAPV